MIAGVKTKSLALHSDERGRLMEILRRDDDIFTGFGQVYMTTAYPGVVKAWHFHEKQTDNFTCVRGTIKLALYDNRPDSPTRGEIAEFFIGDSNRLLVQIPPGVYHGFKGVGTEEALVINIPTEPFHYHAPDEHRIPPYDKSIPYDWSLKER